MSRKVGYCALQRMGQDWIALSLSPERRAGCTSKGKLGTAEVRSAVYDLSVGDRTIVLGSERALNHRPGDYLVHLPCILPSGSSSSDVFCCFYGVDGARGGRSRNGWRFLSLHFRYLSNQGKHRLSGSKVPLFHLIRCSCSYRCKDQRWFSILWRWYTPEEYIKVVRAIWLNSNWRFL